MIQQVIKHNHHYILTPKLIRAVFGEKETRQLVASMFSSHGSEQDREENLKAQQAQEKVSEILSKMNRNKMNVAMNKTGEDIPP
jgi:hypothetical protein